MACGKKGATETPSEPTTTEPTSTDPGKGSTTQIANPASVNCIDKGGTLEIVDAPEGQHGICTLKDTVHSRRTLKQSNSATQFSSGDLPRWPSWSELRRDLSLLFPVAVAGLLHGAGAVLFWPAFAMARFGRSKRNQIAD